jgi:hypothetical protein
MRPHRRTTRKLTADLQFFQPLANSPWKHHPTLCHPDLDFLYVALTMTACAAFSEESRMRFANANKLDRKSGGAQPSDLLSSPSAINAGCPIQALFWLEWYTTALDAPFSPSAINASLGYALPSYYVTSNDSLS